MHPQIPEFQIGQFQSQPNIVLSLQTVHQWKDLFIFQMLYKSIFQKFDPYDWFCGPGSHK